MKRRTLATQSKCSQGLYPPPGHTVQNKSCRPLAKWIGNAQATTTSNNRTYRWPHGIWFGQLETRLSKKKVRRAHLGERNATWVLLLLFQMWGETSLLKKPQRDEVHNFWICFPGSAVHCSSKVSTHSPNGTPRLPYSPIFCEDLIAFTRGVKQFCWKHNISHKMQRKCPFGLLSLPD